MLVALLMGLAATAVMFAVDSSGPQKKLKRDTHKLAALTQYALDRATLTSRDFGIVFNGHKYHFVELVEQRWQAIDDKTLAEQQLQNGIVALEVEGFMWLPEQQDFSSSELFQDREVDRELDEKEKQHIPQVLVLSSGELTPFKATLRISDDNARFLSQEQQDYRVSLTADSLGLITVGDGNEKP
ncbi:type II secretion system protein GspH [Alteromonadales bacterium alter-6D02]|nr:type II secretion system protein GspH [Alteromonadales bacterium alter-6D02]